MARPNPFLNEVIWAFADMNGAIPMRRGDVSVLAVERGYTAKEADTLAFAGFIRKAVGEEATTLTEARAILEENDA